MRVCPICKIEIKIYNNNFATPAVARNHINGTICNNISSYKHISCINGHTLRIIRENMCRGCHKTEQFYIEPLLPFRRFDGSLIKYGDRDQFIHVNGITHNLVEISEDQFRFVDSLMRDQRLHPPQINKEMQIWLLCSRRMGVHKDIRLLICRYLKMYPHYTPPPPPPPRKIPWTQGIIISANIAGKIISPGLYALYSVLLLLYSCRWMDILAFIAIHTKFWMVGIAWFIYGYPNRSIYINAILMMGVNLIP
jgi:hypothetical protein